MNDPVPGEAELLRLRLQLALGGAGPGDEEAHAAGPLDQLRHRLEREVEALLVDEPADHQHELLVRRRELRAQPRQVGHRLQVGRVDPVRDHAHARGLDPERARDVLAHVGRAGDHAVRVADHPALDAVDVRLRVLLHPALVAAELRRVDGDQPRHLPAPREPARGGGDEPVVRVDDVEPAAELEARRAHVVVHVVDPADEGGDVVARERRLAHAVDEHAVAVLRVLAPARERPTARQDMHLDAVAHELLGELAHVAREPALDDRWVLPAQDQHARAHGAAGHYRCPAAPGLSASSPSRPAGPRAPPSAGRARGPTAGTSPPRAGARRPRSSRGPRHPRTG